MWRLGRSNKKNDEPTGPLPETSLESHSEDDHVIVKCAVLGDSGVGKTSLLARYAMSVKESSSSTLQSCEKSSDIEPTVGIEYVSVREYIKGASKLGDDVSNVNDANAESSTSHLCVKLQIWDPSGEPKYHSILQEFLSDSNIIVLVFDLTSEESYSNLDIWLNLMRIRGSDSRGSDSPKPNNQIFVIVGNKCDQKSKFADKTIQEFANANQSAYVKASALTGKNVRTIFTTAIAKLIDGEVDLGESRDSRESGDQTKCCVM